MFQAERVLSRIAGAAIGCALLFSGAAAQTPESAASYPSRNIVFLVGYPPGGPPDLVARTVMPVLSELLGKPIVIENRTGASGSIAASALARSAPDGYTLGSYDMSVAVAPLILASVGFDPVKDFTAIVSTAVTPMSSVIDPNMPAKSAKELVALAKQKPGEVKLAHAGVGSPPHLAAASFLQGAGVNMLLVPYRGSAAAIQDVVAGHVSMLFTGPSTSISLAREGKVRMVGVTGSKRLAGLPDVPTFDESGIPIKGMENGQWFGIGGPAGIPKDIVAKINAATNKALSVKAVQEQFAKIGFTTTGGTADELQRLAQEQNTSWRQTLSAIGVKPE